MDEATRQKFAEYARLKNEAAAIKERLDTLEPDLLQTMLDIDGDKTKIETPIGSFTIRQTKTWTYPDAIVNAEEALKIAKKTAQKEGDATYEENPGLSFRRKTV